MINYLLYYFIIIPLSVLPMRVLFVFSDLLYLVLYKLIGYRTEVVRANLKNAFPEKSDEERKNIERRFYHHLCDLIVEGVKNFTIDGKAARKRMKIRNPELPERFYKQGKNLVFIGGHHNNWELYAIAVNFSTKFKMMALFTPMQNKFFDDKVRSSRSKHGTLMLGAGYPAIRKIMAQREEPSGIIFASDQSPRKNQKAHWTTFLNQATGVQYGAEKLARDLNLPVVAGRIHKIKRGHYEVEYVDICEDPSILEEGEVMERFMRFYENVIKDDPEYWLWTHKRWKHKPPN